jgi:hypothetical protein
MGLTGIPKTSANAPDDRGYTVQIASWGLEMKQSGQYRIDEKVPSDSRMLPTYINHASSGVKHLKNGFLFYFCRTLCRE